MDEEDKKRLEIEAIPILRETDGYGITDDGVYLPVNHQQLRDLIGKLLTILDALNLPEKAHKAQKALIVQLVWNWWNGAYENSTSSYQGCIAPIVCAPEEAKDVLAPNHYPSNRWGWDSEEEYVKSITPGKASQE